MRATDDKVTGSEKAGEMASDAAQSNAARQPTGSQHTGEAAFSLTHKPP